MVGRETARTEEEDMEERRGSQAKDHGFDFGLFNTMLARC
jgi:hypothetical protein